MHRRTLFAAVILSLAGLASAQANLQTVLDGQTPQQEQQNQI